MRSLSLVKSLEQQTSKFSQFWDSFGKNLKMGVVEDTANRDLIARLCRFRTSYCQGKGSILDKGDFRVSSLTSLDSYVQRMIKGQDVIYYLASSENRSL